MASAFRAPLTVHASPSREQRQVSGNPAAGLTTLLACMCMTILNAAIVIYVFSCLAKRLMLVPSCHLFVVEIIFPPFPFVVGE